jgi:beta-N-acetylhexosaminidase
MSTEEKVGQLFFAHCPAKNKAELAAEHHLGGYLLFRRDLKDKSVQQVQEEIAAWQEGMSIPLLIGADEEGGTVARVSGNPKIRKERFLSPGKLYQQGGLEAILADCQEKDALLLSLGINVNFAPVADLSTDPGDFIYDRTLGQGTEETCEYIAAVVARMEEDGMGSVLKHFPGYGPNKDTHTGAALDQRPLDQLRQADFLPFQAGIEAARGGTAAVLVSHNILQDADPDRPGSLSPAVYRLLREELRFDGPALTDDLSMKAITKYAKEQGQSPAVLAIAAGCDMVVTADFRGQIPQVLAALKDGSLSQERVDEALARVLGWKYDLGLISQETLTS